MIEIWFPSEASLELETETRRGGILWRHYRRREPFVAHAHKDVAVEAVRRIWIGTVEDADALPLDDEARRRLLGDVALTAWYRSRRREVVLPDAAVPEDAPRGPFGTVAHVARGRLWLLDDAEALPDPLEAFRAALAETDFDASPRERLDAAARRMLGELEDAFRRRGAGNAAVEPFEGGGTFHPLARLERARIALTGARVLDDVTEAFVAGLVVGALWRELQWALPALRMAVHAAGSAKGGKNKRRGDPEAAVQRIAELLREGWKLCEAARQAAKEQRVPPDALKSVAATFERRYRDACKADPNLPRPRRGHPPKDAPRRQS